MYIKEENQERNMESEYIPVERNRYGGETKGVEQLGKKIASTLMGRENKKDYFSGKEAKKTREFLDSYGLKENSNQESLVFPDNSALYTTIVADFVDQRLRPQLLAEELIRSVRVDPQGASGIKIPVNTLLVADDLPDSGDVTYQSDKDYSATEITLGWKYVAQRISHQLITQSNIDIVMDQLGLMGFAISNKVDQDIIASFETATPDDGSEDNYRALGDSVTLTYKELLQGLTDSMANDAMPDAVLMSPKSLYNLLSDDDSVKALANNSVQPGQVFPMTTTFLGLRVLVSNNVSENDVFIIDSNRTGYFLEGSAVEVMDGRISQSTAQEFIAVKLYGVEVVQPKTVYRLQENTAE